MRANDPFEIVPFEPPMAEPLVRMWRESFEHGVGVVDPHPIEDQLRYLLEQVVPHHRVDVARRGDTIVGFVAANAESIAQLYVRVGCHRQGIGTRLLDLAKQRSSGSLWLFTFARNAIARSFYERNGFTIVARGFERSWQLDDLEYAWTRHPGAAS